MNFANKLPDELIEDRKLAREKKNWQLSDEIRNYLDAKLIFVFDTKDSNGEPFQEVYYLTDGYFNRTFTYTGADGKEVAETKIEKVERLYGISFKSKREFVEWNIKQDAVATKRMEAWIYSILSSQNPD